MAKTNYTFEKRQKELAKQKKQADKLLKKTAAKEEQNGQAQPTIPPSHSNSPLYLLAQ